MCNDNVIDILQISVIRGFSQIIEIRNGVPLYTPVSDSGSPAVGPQEFTADSDVPVIATGPEGILFTGTEFAGSDDLGFTEGEMGPTVIAQTFDNDAFSAGIHSFLNRFPIAAPNEKKHGGANGRDECPKCRHILD